MKFPRQDLKFVGRAGELKELRTLLSSEGKGAVTQKPGSLADGGAGKTTLAIAYAHAHADDYPGGLYFLDGRARFLLTELAKLADRLGVEKGPNQQQTAKRVTQRLNSGQLSLVVVDALAQESKWGQAIDTDLFSKNKCHLLVTTNLPRVSNLKMQSVGNLSPDEGFVLLSKYREDAVHEKNAKIARDIVDRLDGVPLALSLVGAYMAINSERSWTDCDATLKKDGFGRKISSDANEFRDGVNSLFDTLLKSLEPQHRIALEYAALMAENRVMTEWLIELLESDEVTELVAMHNYEYRPGKRVIADLMSWQLLRFYSHDNRVLALHPALRQRFHERFKEGTHIQKGAGVHICELAERRAELCTKKWREKPVQVELSPLVGLVNELHAQGMLDRASKTAKQVSPLLHRHKRFHDLVELLEGFAVQDVVEKLDPKLAAVLLSDHGSGLFAIGDLKAAARDMERAIQIDQRNRSPNDPTLASRYSNFAGILRILGQFAKARRFIQQAIEIEQEQFGKDDQRLGLRYWWLGDIELAEGKNDEALSQYRLAHKIMSKHHRPGHLHVVSLEKLIKDLDKSESTASNVQAETPDAAVPTGEE